MCWHHWPTTTCAKGNTSSRIAGIGHPKSKDNQNYYAQHDLPAWIGGQGTVAYEQYTQQSPSSGFKTV